MRVSHECINVKTVSMARKWRMKALGMTKSIRGYTVDVTCRNETCITPEHCYLRPWGMCGGKYSAIAALLASLEDGQSFELNYLPNASRDVAHIYGGISANSVARYAKFSIQKKPGEFGVKITRTGTY